MATEFFVHSNMKLVISCALAHCDPRDPRIIDIISDGTVGLVWAIERFDLKKPFRFSTYAVWWINSAIKKGLRYYKKRESHSTATLRTTFAKGIKELTHLSGTFPTESEVAEFLKWDRHQLRLYQKSQSEPPVEIHNIEADIPGRLDQPEELASRAENKEMINRVLSKLSAIEEDIIRRRYGIDCRQETLIEIATFYSLARERIRQIETAGLRRIFILRTDIGEDEYEEPEDAEENEEAEQQHRTRAKVIAAMRHLDPVSHDVITSYYGIGRKRQTSEQIAKAYGLTSDDIDGILERAIDTLSPIMDK